MAKKKEKVITKRKKIKKIVKKSLRLKNIGKVLVILATIALLATSILPYIL